MPENASMGRQMPRAAGTQPRGKRKRTRIHFDDDDLDQDVRPVPEVKQRLGLDDIDWSDIFDVGDGPEEEATLPVGPPSSLEEEPEAPAPGVRHRRERRAPDSPAPERRKRSKLHFDDDGDLLEDPELAKQREREEAERLVQERVFEATGVDYDAFMRDNAAQDATPQEMQMSTTEEEVLDQAAPEASAEKALPNLEDRLDPRLIYKQKHLLKGRTPQLSRREQKKLDKADKEYSKAKMYMHYGDLVLDKKGAYKAKNLIDPRQRRSHIVESAFNIESEFSKKDVDSRNISALLKNSRRFKRDAKRRAKDVERLELVGGEEGEEKLSRPKMEQWDDLSGAEQRLWGTSVEDRAEVRDELYQIDNPVPQFQINVNGFNKLTKVEDMISGRKHLPVGKMSRSERAKWREEEARRRREFDRKKQGQA